MKPREDLLVVQDLVKHFPVRSGLFRRSVGAVRAVDGVSFSIARGETLALVGESGCGKSTTGRCILALTSADAGSITFDEREYSASQGGGAIDRKRIQVVFQDPAAALTTHLTVAEQVGEPLRNLLGMHDRRERAERVGTLLERVGLSAADMHRYPHEFSGGQRQRICIARALACEPDLIVCDEAVSALDVSIKAQIVNLLIDLQEERGLALLFISHDLGIVESIAHRVAVMYLGKIVEIAAVADLFDRPHHPYTQSLLASAPAPEPDAARRGVAPLQGDVPSPSDPPSGCRFRTRCLRADARCAEEEPELTPRPGGTVVACHHLDAA